MIAAAEISPIAEQQKEKGTKWVSERDRERKEREIEKRLSETVWGSEEKKMWKIIVKLISPSQRKRQGKMA